MDLDGAGSGSAVTTGFAYDGENVFADFDGGTPPSLTTRYLRGDVIDQIFARIGAPGGATELNWLLQDRQGSVREVRSANGGEIANVGYDGFGNVLGTAPAGLGRYTWTGRERDVEIDLQYNRARYYDPATGRWIHRDPLGFDAGDSNLYRYVNNGPTNGTDPSGLWDYQGFFAEVKRQGGWEYVEWYRARGGSTYGTEDFGYRVVWDGTTPNIYIRNSYNNKHAAKMFMELFEKYDKSRDGARDVYDRDGLRLWKAPPSPVGRFQDQLRQLTVQPQDFPVQKRPPPLDLSQVKLSDLKAALLTPEMARQVYIQQMMARDREFREATRLDPVADSKHMSGGLTRILEDDERAMQAEAAREAWRLSMHAMGSGAGSELDDLLAFIPGYTTISALIDDVRKNGFSFNTIIYAGLAALDVYLVVSPLRAGKVASATGTARIERFRSGANLSGGGRYQNPQAWIDRVVATDPALANVNLSYPPRYNGQLRSLGRATLAEPAAVRLSAHIGDHHR